MQWRFYDFDTGGWGGLGLTFPLPFPLLTHSPLPSLPSPSFSFPPLRSRVVNSRKINFPGLVQDSIHRVCVRQFSPAVIVNVIGPWPTHVCGMDHTYVHVRVGGPRHLCGRGGRHLSLLTSAPWRTGHWSRTDALTIARISCCCGIHIIHADSKVITVNSAIRDVNFVFFQKLFIVLKNSIFFDYRICRLLTVNS